MRLVPVSQLRENSKLAIDILDVRTNKLLRKGYHIKSTQIEALKRSKVASVYITDEYCYFNSECNYVSQPSFILRNVILLKRIGQLILEGTANHETIIESRKIVRGIIDYLDAEKNNLNIVYEPKKMVINDYEERTIYIAMMSSLFALKIGLSPREAGVICLGALLRDIALLVPNMDWSDHKASSYHPIQGYKYLKENFDYSEDVLQVILHHQELFDGKGYPNKLKGEQICIGARIIAIVEMYYKIKRTPKFQKNNSKTLEESFLRLSSHLDPRLLKLFLEYVDVYAPDTLVKLTNGDIAVVTPYKCLNPFRPQVQIIKSKTYEKDELLRLSKTPKLDIKTIIPYVD